MDEKTEALIGPEPVIDPAAEEALERKVREQDSFSFGMVQWALVLTAIFVVAFLFLLSPIFAFLGRPGQLLLWILVNLPLVAFVRRVWRQSRFPLGMGHAIEGGTARSFALALLLLSLTTFFAAGLAEEAWQWVATPGW